jgi:hypothetical protein
MTFYQPTKEDIQLVENFANESAKFHFHKGRQREKVIDDIFVGKLGELAFHRMFPESTPPNFEIMLTADPGWDLKIGDNRVQIKTIRSGVNWVSFNDWNWDELAVMQYEPTNHTITFLHINTKLNIKRNAKRSKFQGWYIPA